MRLIVSDADIQEGLAALLAADSRLVPLAERAGPIPLRRHEPGFAGLCAVIVSQQLSVASANAIWQRTAAAFSPLTPESILAADDPAFTSCGLSRPKVKTLRALARAICDNRLNLEGLAALPALAVDEHLIAVSGIGPWTAQIYRMFHLGDADAFAPGDLALQEAVRIGFDLAARPSSAELGVIADIWHPWRGVAARLLWAYYRAVKSREGIA